ncbi:hypothetical protein MMJ63_21150, partial [Bacillus vallismortis]|nr:hypothetical protein [Bacillus vallismortis]
MILDALLLTRALLIHSLFIFDFFYSFIYVFFKEYLLQRSYDITMVYSLQEFFWMVPLASKLLLDNWVSFFYKGKQEGATL